MFLLISLSVVSTWFSELIIYFSLVILICLFWFAIRTLSALVSNHSSLSFILLRQIHFLLYVFISPILPAIFLLLLPFLPTCTLSHTHSNLLPILISRLHPKFLAITLLHLLSLSLTSSLTLTTMASRGPATLAHQCHLSRIPRLLPRASRTSQTTLELLHRPCCAS